jgi:hypothetical protein
LFAKPGKRLRWMGSMLLVSAMAGAVGAQSTPATVQRPAPQSGVTPNSVVPTTVRVHGTITDPDGDLVPGATVNLTLLRARMERTACRCRRGSICFW